MEREPPITSEDVQAIMESFSTSGPESTIWWQSFEERTKTRMDPKKRKRIEERHAEWLRTDPLQQRLRERIEYHRARAEEDRAQKDAERRESS